MKLILTIIKKLMKSGKARRKARRKAKRRIRFLARAGMFCVGAACMGSLLYFNKHVVAATVNGKLLPAGRKLFSAGKALLKKVPFLFG